MTEQATGVEPERCPWCSSDRGADAEGRCLSCGAALHPDPVEGPLPGITDVDTLAIIKQRGARSPNRIVAWVTGDSPDAEAWAPAGEALDQPSLDVQREMLRLEFDAAIAAQQAELEARKADEALAAAERSARQADVPTADADGQETEADAREPDAPAAVDSEVPAVPEMPEDA